MGKCSSHFTLIINLAADTSIYAQYKSFFNLVYDQNLYVHIYMRFTFQLIHVFSMRFFTFQQIK